MALCGLLGSCDSSANDILGLPTISLNLDPFQTGKATDDSEPASTTRVTQAQATVAAATDDDDDDTPSTTEQTQQTTAVRTTQAQVTAPTTTAVVETRSSETAKEESETASTTDNETSSLTSSTDSLTSSGRAVSSVIDSLTLSPSSLASDSSVAPSSSNSAAALAQKADAKSNDSGLPIGAIVGISIGGIFALVVLSWLIMFCCKRSRKRADDEAIANWSETDLAGGRSASPLALISEKQETASIRSFNAMSEVSAAGPNTTAYAPAPPSNAFRGPMDRGNVPYPYGNAPVNYMPAAQPYPPQIAYQHSSQAQYDYGGWTPAHAQY